MVTRCYKSLLLFTGSNTACQCLNTGTAGGQADAIDAIINERTLLYAGKAAKDYFCPLMPETMSSTRKMRDAASIAVLTVCTFTAYGSQMRGPSFAFMSATCVKINQ